MKTKPIITTRCYASPAGELLLGSMDGQLCLCDWLTEKHHERVLSRLRRQLGAEVRLGTSAVIEEAARQLDEYFAAKRTTFHLPLLTVGTDFQKTVWRELLNIPYGATLSYGELARRIGRPTSFRAVANANGANALSIVIPCHRVVGTGHQLGGYGGGVEAKRLLLALEEGGENA